MLCKHGVAGSNPTISTKKAIDVRRWLFLWRYAGARARRHTSTIPLHPQGRRGRVPFRCSAAIPSVGRSAASFFLLFFDSKKTFL